MKNIDDLLKSIQNEKIEKIDPKDVPVETFEFTNEFLFNKIKTYTDVCKMLGQPIESDPHLQLKQIAKLFNGNWKPLFNGKQKNYYPYFDCSGGFCFDGSDYCVDLFDGMVSYYRSKEISNYVGQQFIDIYKKLSESYL